MITYYDDFYDTILLLLVNERKVTGSDVRFVQLLGNVLDSALNEKNTPQSANSKAIFDSFKCNFTGIASNHQ